MNTPSLETAGGPAMTVADGNRDAVHVSRLYGSRRALHPRAALESQRPRRNEINDSTLGVA
jgi:hypothetical protein